jgi:hypothetical protein
MMTRMMKCIAATSLVICISMLSLSASASGAESAATRATKSSSAQHAVAWPAKVAKFIGGFVKTAKAKKAVKALKHADTASDIVEALSMACDEGRLPVWVCRWMTETVSYGVGFTNSSTPVWGPTGAVAYNLGPGQLVQLECWSTGPAQARDGWSSKLYYRLPDGGWVNDLWIFTGTNSVQQGVRHC